MNLLWQDVIVTLVSAGAAAMLLQRVLSLMRPPRNRAGCAACDKCASSLNRSSRPV